MGGCCCCCCAAKSTELSSTPAYYYYPRASEEQLPLSTNNGAASVLAPGRLLDTNLGTSLPDTYRPPPAPLPFNVAMAPHTTTLVSQQTPNDKAGMVVHTTTSDSVQETTGANPRDISVKPEDLMISDGKDDGTLQIGSPKKMEIEFSKSDEKIFSAEDQEDVCPTCLEEYDAENPKIITKCEHHFHLSCILEWMERSDTCPVCGQEMIFNLPTA